MKHTNRRSGEPRLQRPFYRRDAVTVARALLGQRIVSNVENKTVTGIIVETEAYLGIDDKAAHTYGGRRSARNESMWGEAGFAYVYFVYGMHHCVNVVAGGVDQPIAVLLRALEPEEGVAAMFRRRAAAGHPTDLCSGPGKLCQALGITRRLDGVDLVQGSKLWIERRRRRALPDAKIVSGARIGVGYAEEWQHEALRFRVRDNPHVSR